MELTLEAITRLLEEKRRELEEFVMIGNQEVAFRKGAIAALEQLKALLKDEGNGGKKDE